LLPTPYPLSLCLPSYSRTSTLAIDHQLTLLRIFALRRPATLKEAGVTHIVSALRFDYKETKGWENYKHCNVQIDDTDDENLIEHFPRVVQFIKDALAEGGGVLIHW
jgi:dual specificity phosphatase 12